MTTLGHVVFYVNDLRASIDFYTRIVGLTLCGKIFSNQAAILTGGSTHHELLLIEVKNAQADTRTRRTGLYHVGWKIGDDIKLLKQKLKQIQELNYPLDGMSDHTVSQSLYLSDPDGNEVELYVDNPAVDWQADDSWMSEPVKPLDL